ncbi:sensor histidine kinase [Amnibacterium kyonggiense]|nr:HAMP domain-containing sensor histidine kinase [Amnibacterium kyonggiense]
MDPDVLSVRRAARRTAWQVAAVSTGLVVGIVGLAALFILDQSRPSELLERPVPGESKIYIGSTEVLSALVVLGVLAVIVIGFASWGISQRAVEPIGRALRMQRAFVADASHELRTPLAVLDTRVQLLERRLARGEPYQDTLTAVRGDTRTMIEIVTDLLLAAEAEATTISAAKQPETDLRQTLASAVDDLRVLAESRGVRIECRVAVEARVRISDVRLRRALVVLVDNAICHAPEGSAVHVDAGAERGVAVIRVTDAGSGITGVHVERVFERFAHGPDTGRRRGFGIGLSLVRDLARRHGGRVAVESTSDAGTTMRLELPVC